MNTHGEKSKMAIKVKGKTNTVESTSAEVTNGLNIPKAAVERKAVGGGYTSLLNNASSSNGFDLGADGEAKTLLKIFRDMVDNREKGTYAVDFDVVLYQSLEHNTSSGLAFDTLAVIGKCEESVVIQCFFITKTRQADYSTATYNTADGTQVAISNVASDVHDATFIKMMTSAMVERYAVAVADITIMNTKVLYDDFDSEANGRREFMSAMANISGHMEINVKRLVSDITLESIANSDDGALVVSVRKVGPQETITDENNVVIAPNLACNISCTTANTTPQETTMNQRNTNVPVAEIYLRTDIVYTGNADAVSASFNATGKLPVERSCFTPVLMIEDILCATPTLAKHVLAVAGTTALLTSNNIIQSTLTPEVLAHLNIRANVSDSDAPTPLKVEDVRANYHNAITDLLSPNVMVGIVVKPGTHGVNYTKNWINDGVMCSTIRAVADGLYSNRFTEIMPANMPLTDAYVETRFSGIYIDDNGNDRPLTEINIVHLLMAMPNQIALHDKWILSQSTNDAATAIALKKEVLDTFCTRGYEITDIQYVAYIRGETLQALSYGLSSSNVKITTNADSVTPSMNTNWAPHSAANAGFSLNNIGMSSLNNSQGPARRIIL